MDAELRVTEDSGEVGFNQIASGDNVINIPLFQRSYRWTKPNLDSFLDDVISIRDGLVKSHFLGVLVLVNKSAKVGQQRLTTCYLATLAAGSVVAEAGDPDWAQDLIQSHMLTRRFNQFPTTTRLVPSANDRQQFQEIWVKIKNQASLREIKWTTEALLPTPSGARRGKMLSAFEYFVKVFRDEIRKEDGLESIKKFCEILLTALSFVTINLRAPNVAPVTFERLNARGERITVADLVRNEIFARVADDPVTAMNIFESSWNPFMQEFKDAEADFEKFLFPYGLVSDPSITKADLFALLRRVWGENMKPYEIVDSMREFSPIFFAIDSGRDPGIFPSDVRRAIADLHSLKVPSSTYSYIFKLLSEVHQEKVSPDEAVKIMRVIESFIFRRAVGGYEPTGLHAVFKVLWQETEANVSATGVNEAIKRRRTVPWPNDAEFQETVINGNLYGRTVARYAIAQFESSRPGETPVDDFEIEHILPQNPHEDWLLLSEDFTNKTNSWANLIPITRTMNTESSNSPFHQKRTAYKESKFASTREIEKHYLSWTSETLEKRATEISEWAVTRWQF